MHSLNGTMGTSLHIRSARLYLYTLVFYYSLDPASTERQTETETEEF